MAIMDKKRKEKKRIYTSVKIQYIHRPTQSLKLKILFLLMIKFSGVRQIQANATQSQSVI